MKTRVNTKFGMATKEPCGDPEFDSFVFDKAVALNGHLKTKTWMLSKEKQKEIGLK
jgi:hypothetical protein